MNEGDQTPLAHIVEKIRLFRDSVIREIECLVRICSHRNYEQGQRVYALGDASEELLLLHTGRFSECSAAGDALVTDNNDLFRTLQANREMHLKIIQNLLYVLGRQLVEANDINVGHAKTIVHTHERLVRDTGKTAGKLG